MPSPARLAALYLGGRDYIPSDLLRAYVSRSLESTIGRVCYVQHDPYESAEHLQAQVQSTGSLLVYTGHSEGLRWEPRVNWHMRAAHDLHDHRDCGFSFAGELQAWRNAANRMGEAFASVLYSEIVLQAAVYATQGTFPDRQRMVLL